MRRPALQMAVLAVATVIACAACTRTHDCRPGTLFLNVTFSPYRDIADVFVQVEVPEEVTRSKMISVPAGTEVAGIEVQFKSYPTGRHATVLVRLDGPAGPLATRTLDVPLTGSCRAEAVSFGAADGGSSDGGGGGGSGGRGSGTGGTGGAGGTASGTGGAGGTTGAGGVGGAISTGGAGMGGRGTGGVVAGTGGVSTGGAGAGGRGTGGVVVGTGGAGTGTGGAAMGTGGAGTGGRGTGGGGVGTGGRGTGGAGAGGRGGCAAAGPEDCFNNRDDDCNGLVDCMDPACGVRAVCVALDPALGEIGIVSANAQAACPTDYTNATTINSGQVQVQCSGCGCAPPNVSCNVDIFDYPTAAACDAADPTSVRRVGSYSAAFPCSSNFTWHPGGNGTIAGVGVGPIVPEYPGCTPTGQVVTEAPTWTTTSRFCSTMLHGGGCGAGSACVPIIANNPQRCVLTPGSATTCPAGTSRTDWFTSTTGTATCNPCSCGGVVGGDTSCDSLRVVIGSDNTCSSVLGTIAGGEQMCFPQGVAPPGIVLTGTPTVPTCTPNYTVAGGLIQTGQRATCCR